MSNDQIVRQQRHTKLEKDYKGKTCLSLYRKSNRTKAVNLILTDNMFWITKMLSFKNIEEERKARQKAYNNFGKQ